MIDINKIVERARASYPKKDKGMAKQLATGTSLIRPSEDKDFIVWTGGDHWQKLTGLRGIPFGRIVQISGKPDSGKSTHAASFMKYAQDQGVLVILWDSEKKFGPGRFKKHIKGDPDKLLIVDTNNITDGVKAVALFVKAAKEIDPKIKILIVWDSVGASLNSSEDNEDNEDFSKQPGVSAKENSYAIKKINKLANRYMDRETGEETIAALLINQTYANIGSVGQTEKGGNEVYYLSSIIIQLSRKQDLIKTKQGEKYKFGIVSRAKVKKNHLFDGEESIAELDLVISADGVALAKDAKKKNEDVTGWEDNDDEEDE